MEPNARATESLRETVQELRQSSRATSEKVDRLSLTVSSTGVRRDLPASDATELRDAIRQLSQTVSEASPASRSVMGRLQQLRGEVDHLRLLSAGRETKGGSLAYAGRVEESAAGATETPAGSSPETPMFTAPNTQRRPPSNRVSDNKGAGEEGKGERRGEEVDDFMAVRPAEVEEGWGVGQPAGGTGGGDEGEGSVAERAARFEEKANGIDQATTPDDDEVAAGRPEEADALATTRRLFQQSMFDEAEKSEGTPDETDRNLRRMSAPNLELPLSDSDI